VGAVGKVQTFLNVGQVTELVTAYVGGATTTELSERFGIHRRTVVLHLHRQGVPLRRQGLTPEHTEDAVRLYQAGSSLAQIAAHFGTTAMTVRRAISARGVRMRPPWERMPSNVESARSRT